MIINQQPTGNGDGVFTYQDLLLTMQQDAWTGTVYFANGSDTIICADSVLNPAIQWCAPKAETWEPPAYVAVVIPPIVCAGTCGIPTPPGVPSTLPGSVVTAEPHYMSVVLLAWFVVLLVVRKIWRINKSS